MIARVHQRGEDLSGLLDYLYGPGKREEHADARLVAAWTDDPSRLEPAVRADGGPDLGRMISLLVDPVRSSSVPAAKPVWHCSLRLAGGDRVLSDREWGRLAAEFMAGTGIAPGGDQAVRWIAVRHGDDHIHVVATLNREDGRREWAFRDYLRCRDTARDLERRYGLTVTAPADGTAPARPGPHELNKALRQRRAETPRDQLRRHVRHASAATDSTQEFFDALRRDGVLLRLRHDAAVTGRVVGYAVALPGDVAGDGRPVFYGGGRLAPELTLPRLRDRWGETGTASYPAAALARGRTPTGPAGRTATLHQAVQATGEATALIRAADPGDPAEALEGAAAAADTLTVTARLLEGTRYGELSRAAEELDRATARTRDDLLSQTRRCQGLRSMSRLLALMGHMAGDPELFAALQLILKLSQLADHLADLRDGQDRAHQARAARAAATRLRQAAADLRPPVPRAPAPRVALRSTPPATGHDDRRRQAPPGAAATPQR